MKIEKFVRKDWGYERWITNTEDYCMKHLFCMQGIFSSDGKFHFHKEKDETFYCIKGYLLLQTVDRLEIQDYILCPNFSIRLRPNTYHRFTAITETAEFIEASTHHDDEDTYRVSINELVESGDLHERYHG